MSGWKLFPGRRAIDGCLSLDFTFIIDGSLKLGGCLSHLILSSF